MSDDEGPGSAKKAKTTGNSVLPPCPYGSRCYRKNPQHFKEYSHGDRSHDNTPGSSKSTVQIDTSKLPPCKYGAACYRKNLLHFAEFSHPISGGSSITGSGLPADSSGSDTDVYSDGEEAENEVEKVLLNL